MHEFLVGIGVGCIFAIVLHGVFIGAEDGQTGATSTGKCTISLTIPPRVELTPSSMNTPRVIAEEPMDMEKKVLGSTVVYIFMPKVN